MVKPAVLSEIRIDSKIAEITKIADPLPTGTNTLGKVDIESPLPAGTNTIGKVDVQGTSANTKSKPYEDIDFVVGESPRVLNIYTDLGSKINAKGYIVIDGEGDLLIEYSFDGTNYDTQFKLKKGEVVDLSGIGLKKIRLAHSGTDTAYRIVVVA